MLNIKKVLTNVGESLKGNSITDGNKEYIPANADLNSYTTAGVYIVPYDAIAQTLSNKPVSASGKLIVIYSTDSVYLTQVYIPTKATTDIWLRTKSSSNWSAWKRMITEARFEVETGTVTTSATTGTASFSNTYATDTWACISCFTTAAVSGYILTPYKYGDAANGRWGFKAQTSAGNAIGNTSVSYVAIMYNYS